jgi:hypothetical protein
MEFRKDMLSLEQAKQTDIVAYLSSLGYKPVKIKGHSYWYRSPLRGEKTASFKVNTRINRWYDFGLGKGGSILDFCMVHGKLSLAQAVHLLSGPVLLSMPTSLPDFSHQQEQKSIVALEQFELSSTALTGYLHTRGIPVAIAQKYCCEIRYQVGEKIYYGIGFKNDSGGWEIRNPYFKGSTSPKDITTFKNGCLHVSVFEVFFDFLSYVEIAEKLRLPPTDFIILNSLAFTGKAGILLAAYAAVDLYLDNDAAGKNVSLSLIESGVAYRDQSYRYASCKDLNEFWVGSCGDTAAFFDNSLRPP